MPKKSYTLPRGMRDIEHSEMSKRLWLYSKTLEVMRKYNFQLVEPSPIEHLETLEAKSGSSIRDEIYWFEDKANRKLALRFDLTVGLTRMVASRADLPLPVKLCAVSNMWRYDEPQFGRYRCFYQWDAEIFGSSNVEADAEIISLSTDMLKNLGLENFEVRISDRKLVEGFLTEIGIVQSDLEAVLRVIDKYRKLSKEQIIQELENLRLNNEQIEQILNFASLKGSPDQILPQLSLKNEKSRIAVKGLYNLMNDLLSIKKAEKCVLDLSIVRGIGYYDGIVFEIYDKVEEGIGALTAGGRYDSLCKLLGRDLPATGVAGGIERLILSLERAGVIEIEGAQKRAFVISIGEETRGKALEIVGMLRSRGISTDYDLKARSLTKQLEYADKLNINFVVIVGKSELKVGKVKVKDMQKHQESEVQLRHLEEYLLSLLTLEKS